MPPAAALTGLLMGYTGRCAHTRGPAPGGHRPPGFWRPEDPEAPGQPIWYTGDSHLITIGPTGSGKSRGAAIPALLHAPGSVIALDVKGELYQTTAARRRALGQRVLVLDLLGLCDQPDALNPMDSFDLPGSGGVEASATILATLLNGLPTHTKDMFWDNNALALNTGLLAHAATALPKNDRRLSWLREMFASDFEVAVAGLLDGKNITCPLARDELQIFLQHPQRETRPSVQSTAQQHLRLFGLPDVRAATDASTFSLAELVQPGGAGFTLYIVVGPNKLHSHAPLLRLWLGVLMQALCCTAQRASPPTLVLVDEAAALGPMDVLKHAHELLRGYGVRVWSFWQDLSQLRHNYPNDWQTLVNNAGAVQLLRPRNHLMASEFADLAGHYSPAQLMAMGPGEQVLLLDGEAQARICRRPDYLQDPMFQGLYSPNPLFAGTGAGPAAPGQASTQAPAVPLQATEPAAR